MLRRALFSAASRPLKSSLQLRAMADKCTLSLRRNYSSTSYTNVILKRDVEGVGVEGEELTVRRGFARNYLCRDGNVAVYANEKTRAQWARPESSSGLVAEERAQQRRASKIARRLSRTTVQFYRQQRDAESDACRPVDNVMISEKLRRQTELLIPPERISLVDGETASTFGTHWARASFDSSNVIVEFQFQIAKRNPNEFSAVI